MTSRPDTTSDSGETRLPRQGDGGPAHPAAEAPRPAEPPDVGATVGAAAHADADATPRPAAADVAAVAADAPARAEPPAADAPAQPQPPDADALDVRPDDAPVPTEHPDDRAPDDQVPDDRVPDGVPDNRVPDGGPDGRPDGDVAAAVAVEPSTPVDGPAAVAVDAAADLTGTPAAAAASSVQADPAPVAVPLSQPLDQPPVAAAATDAPPTGDAGPSLLPGHPQDGPQRAARGRLGYAMRPRASRAQLLAGLLCALLGFALVVQARQTQTQGLDQLRQADLVKVLDNLTNSEARAEQDLRNQQAIRDRLLSGSDSSDAARQAAQQRLDILGLLAGTVPATGPGIELEITDPRRQIDASVLLDTLEELRDGGAEVVQIGDARVVAATAFTDEADGVRVDERLLTAPYRFKVIGEPQTLAKVLQIPGGVLDVLRSKGAQGRVTQSSAVHVDALRPAATPQYARPAPGGP